MIPIIQKKFHTNEVTINGDRMGTYENGIFYPKSGKFFTVEEMKEITSQIDTRQWVEKLKKPTNNEQ